MTDFRNLDFSKKKVVIVGLGISGLWTVRYLAAKGAKVTVTELKPEQALAPEVCKEIREHGGMLETGGHKKETLLNADMIVISPGVPHDMPLFIPAKEKGIPILGELELASRLIDTPMIAVTGTNGKSTVTALLGALLENAGFKVFVGGNIGMPLMAYAAKGEQADYAVVEVSSFQLDSIETFRPFISIILNISPDHLDRYRDYEAYVQSKLRVFSNQVSGQYAIFNDDDTRLSLINPDSGIMILRYGREKKRGRHAYLDRGRIRAIVDDGQTRVFALDAMTLPGRHNAENVMAVVLGGLALGIRPSVIQKTIDGFKGLPHRMERIGEIDGVVFYNDSKATNVDAALKSILSFDGSLILVAGGRHKGADYAPLVASSRGRVKRAVFLGEACDMLARAFKGVIPFSMAEDMQTAVSDAFSFAEAGDVVLLAPGCSSFDMFSDYSQRGEAFRKAVEALGRGE